MLRLIQNEIGKIFAKKSGWIFPLILIVILVAAGYIYEKLTTETEEDWKVVLQNEIKELEEGLEQFPESPYIQKEIEYKKYYLEQNMNPDGMNNWKFLNANVGGLLFVVTLFAVIIGSRIVAAEFSDGTIKQLLIRPHPRWVILLSKYISTLIYTALLFFILILAGYIVGTLFFGSGDFEQKMLEQGAMDIFIVTIGDQILTKIAYALPQLVITITIAFMLSTLFRSQSLAVGIGIFTMFLSNSLGSLVLELAKIYPWTKFLIFPHMNLAYYTHQDTIMGNITLPISLLIVAIYYVIFLGISFYVFQKRDVSL